MTRIIMLFVAALSISLAGCNTMHGLGKDIEQVGDSIQRKAK